MTLAEALHDSGLCFPIYKYEGDKVDCRLSTMAPPSTLPTHSEQGPRSFLFPGETFFKKQQERGVWLVQSVEHVTPNLRVGSSSPMVGVEIT